MPRIVGDVLIIESGFTGDAFKYLGVRGVIVSDLGRDKEGRRFKVEIVKLSEDELRAIELREEVAEQKIKDNSSPDLIVIVNNKRGVYSTDNKFYTLKCIKAFYSGYRDSGYNEKDAVQEILNELSISKEAIYSALNTL